MDPPVIPLPKQNGEPGQSDPQNEGVGDEEVNLNIDNGQDTTGFGKFQKLCRISYYNRPKYNEFILKSNHKIRNVWTESE